MKFRIAFVTALAFLLLIAARTYEPIDTYVIVAVFYLAIVFILTQVMVFAEKRLRIPGLEMDAQRV